MKRAFVLVLMALLFIAPIHVIAQSDTRKTIATVNNEPIYNDTFVSRFKYERFLHAFQISQSIKSYQKQGYSDFQIIQELELKGYIQDWVREQRLPDVFGQSVMDHLIDEHLIQQEAVRMKITVDNTDTDREIERFFGFSDGITNLSKSDNAAFDETYKQFNSDLLNQTGLTEKDIRPFFEASALQRAMKAVITKDFPITLRYIHLRHILVNNQTDADAILKQLQTGKSFESLAKQYSIDVGSAINGGELDWTLISDFPADFAAATQDAPIGQAIGPVKIKQGYDIFYVIGHEDRIGNETQIAAAKDKAYNDWLIALRKKTKSEVTILSSWVDYIPRLPIDYYLPLDLANFPSPNKQQPTPAPSPTNNDRQST